MWRGISFGSTVVVLVLVSLGTAEAWPVHKSIQQAVPVAKGEEARFEADSPIEPAPPSFSPGGGDPEDLNRSEMLSLVRKYSADIAGSLLEGERRRERAVRERDFIKLSCIQDHLAQMKSMKRLADERLSAIDRPAVRADELNLRHEFRGVELAYQRVIELRRELLECVGENLEVTGAPGAEAPTVPADPSASNVESPKTERPIAASPIY